MPNMVDGMLGEDISRVFADKYQTLYNSVSYDKQDIDKLFAQLNDLIANECNYTTRHYLSYFGVLDAMSCVKPGEKDGCGLRYSDHFIYGTNTSIWHCYSNLIIHGY